MSYTVSAATEAAVSASISTPVCAVVAALATMRTPSVLDRDLHIGVRERQRMAERNQLRGAFGRP